MDFVTPLPLEQQFSAVINPKEAAEGILLALRNAKELLEDAAVLLENKRYPRVVALAILAIEEYGKVEKIKELLLSKQKIASLWRELRSHKSKNYPWMFPLLKQMGVNDPELIRDFSNPKSNCVKFLDELKQISFYTEAVKLEAGKGCHWWLPSEIVSDEVADFYYRLAKTIVLDDGIVWTEAALTVYMEYADYQDGKAFVQDMPAYYAALYKAENITRERYEKILHNMGIPGK
ncbi:AbiV family abortive infection protein [Pedobacter sp. FW305-3-2-15-E-R2A2]|uniref:AbiV family abortive infection protein n=1 Tax=Pedobacter sp. FW305-3-2-15-E-R2A2 TaxID=3140251 RepID=UPI00313FE454